MAHKIIWSQTAENDYFDIIDYLLGKWGEKTANGFVKMVDIQLELISKMPKMYPKTAKKEQIRRCVVVKQIAMYYMEFEVEEEIHLARFLDNRKNPNKFDGAIDDVDW